MFADYTAPTPDAQISLGIVAGIAAALCLYFAPAALAILRGHRSWMAIGLTCLFFGWTVIGWLVALIWAFGDTGERR